ncbi:MAG: hypothetical protein OK474_01640 [Thaumarchaeota archaeon]|nr:hypothetical protein [Nitrososphaerota archaeon]
MTTSKRLLPTSFAVLLLFLLTSTSAIGIAAAVTISPNAVPIDPVTTLYFRTDPAAIVKPHTLSTTPGTVPVAETFDPVNGMTSNGQPISFASGLMNGATVTSANFVVNLANNGNAETLNLVVSISKNGVTLKEVTMTGITIPGAGTNKQFTVNIPMVNTAYNAGDTLDCTVRITGVFDNFKGAATTADTIQLIYNGNSAARGAANNSQCQINADAGIAVPEFGTSAMLVASFGLVAVLALRLIVQRGSAGRTITRHVVP